MTDVLQKIYSAKAALLEREEVVEPYPVLRDRAISRRSERRPFLTALRRSSRFAIVAEIKRASPSAGQIAAEFQPAAIARCYEAAGTDAISVLTERDHFLGDLGYLDSVRAVTTRPILRKDFLWTRYHVAQSAAYGADCILLIVAGMADAQLRECMDEALEYEVDAVVEVHDATELRRAVALGAELIGINNRDLRTLAVDLSVTQRLLPSVPPGTLAMSESGIAGVEDIKRLRSAGVKAFLIGEALMRAENPAALIQMMRTAG